MCTCNNLNSTLLISLRSSHTSAFGSVLWHSDNVLAKWLSQVVSYACAVTSTCLARVSVCTVPRLVNSRSSQLPHPKNVLDWHSRLYTPLVTSPGSSQHCQRLPGVPQIKTCRLQILAHVRSLKTLNSPDLQLQMMTCIILRAMGRMTLGKYSQLACRNVGPSASCNAPAGVAVRLGQGNLILVEKTLLPHGV